MVKLSIIIPIFNGEKYIKNCVDSIIKSKIRDYEILLINDGSTDNTSKIINELNNGDTIKAFDISHRGLSNTRNFGLEKALGEYISFIDVDDEVTHYDYKAIGDSDLLVFGYHLSFIDENYRILKKGINQDYGEPKAALKTIFDLDLFNFAWNKIYKAEIIKDIKFSDKYYQGEDLAFNVEVFKKINNLKIIEDCLYVYKKRNTETMVSKYVKDYDVVLKNKYELLKEIFDENDATFNDYMLKEYEVFVINMFKSKDLNFKKRNILIKDNVLNRLDIVRKGNAQGLYSKIFKLITMSNKASVINVTYGMLVGIKKILGNSYLKIRKKIYLTDYKKTS